MEASAKGHEVVVEALLKGGATVNMPNEVHLLITSSHKHPMHMDRTSIHGC